ncbi:MAG: type IX secretion system protein PorQ [Muribaculaceae bacterium]|nr:type IX secretion system protein PorQ [Muribaculaceae bacterium]
MNKNPQGDITLRIMSVVAAIAVTAFSFVAKGAEGGSTAYNFLDVTQSTRIYGLGGVNVSIVEDNVMTSDQNPALLGPEVGKQIGLGYMRNMGGTNYASARYGMGLTEHSAFAVGVRYFGYGSMTSTDVTGQVTGNFSASDIAVSLGYSHDITDRLRGGINLKLITSSYDHYSALALGTDIGVNYYNDEEDSSVSLTVSNLGGQIKRFNESYDRLPIDVRLGFTRSLSAAPIRLSVTAFNLTKWHLPYTDVGDGTSTSEFKTKDKFASNLFRHLVFAAEVIPNDNFYIGIGYNYKNRTDMSTYSRSFVSGFSATAGFNARGFSIGAAVAQHHTGAATFMVNLGIDLDEILR